MNKIALVSVFMNVLFLIICINILLRGSVFYGQDNIIKTLEFTNKDIGKKVGVVDENLGYVLSMKPKIKKPYEDFFRINREILIDFEKEIDSLLEQDFISEKELKVIYIQYNNAILGLRYWYAKTIEEVQREAKLKESEVEEKILNFKKSINERQFFNEDLKGISFSEKKLLLNALKTQIVSIATISGNDFSSMFTSRHLRYYRNYPIVVSSINEVKKGDSFEAKIAIGSFIDYPLIQEKIFSVQLNKDTLGLENGRGSFAFQVDQLGSQEYECIVSWKHPKTEIIGSDTTYFNYTVIQ